MLQVMGGLRASRLRLFFGYEFRRAIARRKLLVLVAATVLLDTLPYYALAAKAPDLIPTQYHPYLWVVGVYAPHSFFIQFIAIFIAAGAMSEEYEQGTAELLLAKPVSKSEYFFGKYLGGLALLFSLTALNAALALVSAYTSFGAQVGLGALPYMVLGEAASSIIFYSMAFMFGELVRRSTLSYILSSAVFFASAILAAYFGLVAALTGDRLYLELERALPTSPVNSLPLQLAAPRLPPDIRGLLSIVGPSNPVEPTMVASITLIALYAGLSTIAAYAYFCYADVSKKVV